MCAWDHEGDISSSDAHCCDVPAAALSVLQLIMYNSVEHQSNNPSCVPRHIRTSEDSLVIQYISITIYAKTRMEKWIMDLILLLIALSMGKMVLSIICKLFAEYSRPIHLTISTKKHEPRLAERLFMKQSVLLFSSLQ